MKLYGLRTLLISALVLGAQALPAHAGPSLCNGAPNGVLDGNEQCETGPCCTTKCELKAPGTVCRAAANGTCDIAETCGELAPVADAACPADVVAENGTPCDDGLFCNSGETCQAGVCGGGEVNTCDDGNSCTTDTCSEKRDTCLHSKASNGTSCDDGNACTTDDTCSNGICAGGPAVTCDDENACTDDSCDAESGECVFTANTAPCDDGFFCTVDDVCSEGECVGADRECAAATCGTAVCNEATDSCDAGGAAENGTPCDDGLFCTVDDTCQDGVCTGGGANTCDDENDCTTDACKESNDTCTHSKVQNGTSCDDGNVCTTDETCSNGVCGGGMATVCDDENACTDDSCDAIDGCVFTPNTDPCDDGLFCTAGDACSDGACVGGEGNGCDDGNGCTIDSCDEETDGCMYDTAEDGTLCDDGQFCTLDDMCTGGVCAGATENTCDDDNDCTNDSCNEGNDTCKYTNTNNNGPCDDGLFCTVDDTCHTGVCSGVARDCEDENVCTDDSCNEDADQCDNVNNSAPCDDGLYCTTGDTCGGGTCSVNTPTCDDGNACTTDSCDEEADSCSNVNNTDPCEDGLFCTVSDTCADGACGSGPARDCGDGNACTDDSCNEDADQCDNVNNTDPCDDGLFCTENDACADGACTGETKTCDDANDCTDDTCNELDDNCVNVNNAAPCEDGLFCTEGDTCADGTCVSGGANDCDDDSVCTDDSCDEEGDACVNMPNEVVECDDSDACTKDDACVEGVCTGTPIDMCTTTTSTSTTSSTIGCPPYPCGDFNSDCEITAGDALGVLQAAVGINQCSLAVCDFNGDGKISAIDALAVLRAAVDLPSNPMCPEA